MNNIDKKEPNPLDIIISTSKLVIKNTGNQYRDCYECLVRKEYPGYTYQFDVLVINGNNIHHKIYDDTGKLKTVDSFKTDEFDQIIINIDNK